MRRPVSTTLAALLVTFSGATIYAKADEALDKLLHEELGPDDTVTAKIVGQEAFVRVTTKGYLGLTSQGCKLSALMMAQKVMSRVGTVTTTHVQFYGVAKNNYREVTVDASQLASLGTLLDSLELTWHGTKLRGTSSHRPSAKDRWCTAGDVKFLVPEGWLIFPHPPQDDAMSHHTVLARVQYKPQNVAGVVIRVHDVVYLKKQFEFAERYFRESGFHVLSSGAYSSAGNLTEAYQITVQRKIPGRFYDDWEKHVFFEAGGRVYSIILNTSTSSSQEAIEPFQDMIESLQWHGPIGK